MIGRAVCASLALVCESSATQPPNPTYIASYPAVHQVRCLEGRGTAFRTGEHTFLSVGHVARLHFCTIDGHPFNSTISDDEDFAVLDVPDRKLGGFKINCDGFVPGQWYFGVGYAGGSPWQTMVSVYATVAKVDGMTVLLGTPTFIPGMSGGPVLNAAGEVVGTVNAYNKVFPFSYSLALKDTPQCPHS